MNWDLAPFKVSLLLLAAGFTWLYAASSGVLG